MSAAGRMRAFIFHPSSLDHAPVPVKKDFRTSTAERIGQGRRGKFPLLLLFPRLSFRSFREGPRANCAAMIELYFGIFISPGRDGLLV